MKPCKVCYDQKPLTEFYKNSGMADGHMNVCKICHNKRSIEWTKRNRDRVNENNRKRAQLPEIKLARKNYCKSEKAIVARREAVQRYRLKRPYINAAHRFVRLALEKDIWVRAKNCSQCNSSGTIEAHHDDYTKPDVVRWLCKACHEEWHRTNKPIYVSKDIT
jgi:hypothetical protein